MRRVQPAGGAWPWCAAVLLSLLPALAAAVDVREIFDEPRIEGTRPQEATVSPDGRWVAYAWNDSGRDAPLDLWIVPASGGTPRAVTDFAASDLAARRREAWQRLRAAFGGTTRDSLPKLPRYFEDPEPHRVTGLRWSADGRHLLFADRGDLFMVRVPGGTPMRLTHTPAEETLARWSPDGRWVAFVRDRAVWLLQRGRALDVQLAKPLDAQHGILDLVWAPDGKHLAMLYQDDTGRGELHVPNYLPERVADEAVREGYPDMGVRVFDLARLQHIDALEETTPAGAARDGSPSTGERESGDAGDRDTRDVAAWFPDEDTAGTAFPAEDVDLGDGKHPLVGPLRWSPDGRRLAVNDVTADMKTRRILLADPADGSTRLLFEETDPAWWDDYDWVVTEGPVFEWSPDGGAFLITTEASGWHHLALLEVPAGAAKAGAQEDAERVAQEGEEADAQPGAEQAEADPAVHPNEPLATARQLTRGSWVVNWARWLPDGASLVVMTSRKATSERHFEILDLESGERRPLGTAAGMNTHPQLAQDGRTLVYRHSRFATPPDLWSLDVRGRATPRRLTHTVPERFRQVAWNVPEIVDFPARDGTPLKGLLYRPARFDPDSKYPVVVFVHGAGIMQNVVDGWTIYAPNYKFHTVLAERGFAVFEVDYRGSLGYGRDFRAGVYGWIGGKDLEDELAGVDYLRTLGWVDPERIGIYGGSYGGFMALMALFRAPEVYAAGAALRFVADWENYYRGNPWYCIQRLGTPEDNAAAYYRSSPIHFAENLEDPLLLLHGVRDNNVHFQDAAQLVERLIRLRKKFELMIYPVERHGFTRPESWIDEYGRILDFFTRTLRPRLTVDPMPMPAGATAK